MKKNPQLTIIETDATGTSTSRKAPSRGARLKATIAADYEIDDSAHIELLEQVCAAVDRLDDVTARISADGVMVRGQRGLRPHPLLQIEAKLRGFVCRSLAKLGLAP
jgi:hypothetical protein